MNDSSARHIGSAITRVEDEPLLTGRAEFVDDIRLPGMLHLAFHRTDMSHAELGSVDTADAAALAGVHAVVTAVDLGSDTDLTPRLETPGRETYSPPRPLLARARVRFVGEAVAAVVAESRYVAEDACELVFVDYEQLPIVDRSDEAVEPGAALLHPTPSNVLFEHEFETPGVDDAIANADVVIERTFNVGRYAAAPLESRAVLAAPTASGGVDVWTSTQGPHQVQNALMRVLGLDESQARVICPSVGGGFGQKAHVYPEEILIPLLALRFGRPVKWIEDRRENLIASSHARGQLISVRAGATSDGLLMALDADVLCDMGAYGVFPHGHLLEVLGTPIMLPGPYRLPEMRFRARAVATNKCPGGAFRGVGLAPAAFVHERLMNIVAAEVGLDPAEVRRRNLISADELPCANAVGLMYDSGDYTAALDGALERVGHAEVPDLREAARARGKLVGLGYGIYVEYTGVGSVVFQGRGMVDIPGFDEVRIAIDEDGGATLATTLPSAGQGLATTFAQLVAEELHLPVEAVRIPPTDTTNGLKGTGTFASRSAIVGGAAIAKAGETLRRRLLDLAATELEAAVDDLELVDGHVRVRGAPAPAVSYAQLVATAPEGHLSVEDTYDPPDSAYSYGAHACIVEIDPATGALEILRYAIVEDCGRMINPAIVEGQTHGATAQGISAALLEAVAYEDGQPVTTSLMDYLLPTATDVPTFDIGHLEHEPPHLLRAFKGVGEGGVIGGAIAIANAVSDALGADVDTIPVTPADIVRLGDGLG